MLKLLKNVLKLISGGILMIIATVGIYLNLHDVIFLFFNTALLLVGLLLFFTPVRSSGCQPPSRPRPIRPRLKPRRSSIKP